MTHLDELDAVLSAVSADVEYAIGQLRQHRNLDRAMDALERIQRTVCDAMIGYADDAGSDEYDVDAWDMNIPW